MIRVLESRTGPLAPQLVPIEDASRVGEARRAAAVLAAAMGLDEVAQGRAALIATEAAGNLAKHAREGVLLLQAAGTAEAPVLELLAIDRGPGMADPARCLRDGFSTAGTPGTGLGAIQRTADLFDLDSHPGRGTVLLAQVRSSARAAAPTAAAPAEESRLQVGAVCLPLAGERANGDAWLVAEAGERALLLVVDGLGHGEQAAVAATAAIATARAEGAAMRAPGPAALMAQLHAALRPTRGAAVGLAMLDVAAGMLRFSGVGNVAAVVVPGDVDARTRSLLSQNGIVGHQARTAHEVAEPCPPGALLILASDGVRPQWRLEALPGLARRHPSLIAATLWRDLARGRDDATVLVARVGAPTGAWQPA